MGYGREARRVRDVALPQRFRLHSLGSCIQMSQPIGFHATWSYLQATVGTHWRDPELLLPAIELLDGVRALHHGVEAEYADLRREQKRNGYRFPPRDQVTPSTPRRWHGDELAGARHALQSWQQRRNDAALSDHPMGAVVVQAVASAVSEVPPNLAELQGCLNWARRRLYVLGWHDDAPEYRIATVAMHLLGPLHVLTIGPLPVGATWNFSVEE